MLKREEIIRYLKTITTLFKSRYDTYYSSDCYKGLKSRCQLIDDAIDLKFKQNEAFISEIAPPVVNKDYRETNAFIVKYFENDPLASFRPIGATPKSNSDNAQLLVNINFLNTRFREECLTWVFDNFARYGTAAIFSQFNSNYRGAGLQTVYDPNSASPYPRKQMSGKNAVCNYSIHPLNIFQDPRGNSLGKSYYIGFNDQWYVSDLFKYVDNEFYIKENVEAVIKDCKNGHSEQYWFGGNDRTQNDKPDFSRAVVNVIRGYTLLNFSGNDDDSTIYYIEMVYDRIIRCHPVDIDGGIVPLNTGVYMPRPDVWWGNSSIDYKIPFQNLKNWLLNSQIESTMKQMDRLVLVRRGNGLNVADINNRHQTGGVVPFEGLEDPSKLIYPVQFNDASLTNLESLNRDINQMIQETSPVVNLQNKYNQGGLNNSTLGAAQMAAGIGEVIFSYSMKNIGYLIERVSEANLSLLIQNMPDVIKLRRNDNESEFDLEKRELIGEFIVKAQNSMITNEQVTRMNSSNAINQVVNWTGTGRPEFQGIKLNEFIKDWLRSWVGQTADMTLYYQDVQNNGGQVPQMAGPMGGAPQQGMPPQAPPMPQSMQPMTGAMPNV